jgi:hypothetical protein
VVKGLPKPLVPLVVAMVALALAVGAAFVGLGGAGSTDASLTNPSGAPGSQLAVKVDGVSLPSTGDVRLDLSKPVLVEVSPGAPAGTTARLSFLLLGHSVYSASAPVASPPDGAGHADIYATSVRYLLAGRLAVELSLVKGGLTSTDITHQWRFTARTAEAAWVSASGAVVVVLVLFSAAYLEQFARSLWRGKRRVSATAGLVVALALLAVAAAGAEWLTAGRQPTVLSLIVSAALGAVSGLALAPATVRAGRRRRSRQRMAGRARAGALAPGR